MSLDVPTPDVVDDQSRFVLVVPKQDIQVHSIASNIVSDVEKHVVRCEGRRYRGAAEA